MIDFLSFISRYSLVMSDKIHFDGKAYPLRLAVRKIWLDCDLESPDFRINGSEYELTGSDLKKLLIRLGFTSSIDPRLDWLASYPSLILAAAVIDPYGLLHGEIRDSKTTFIARGDNSVWIVAKKLERSILDRSFMTDMIISHQGLGSIVHKIFPLPIEGQLKKYEIKEESKADPIPYETRFTGTSKRFKVAGSPLHPDSVHPYLRDQSQDKFLICFTVNSYPIQGQLNILVNPTKWDISDRSSNLVEYRLGSIEYRSVNRINGSRVVKTIGDLIATARGKFRIIVGKKIEEITDQLDLLNLGKLLPLIGINQKSIYSKAYTLCNIHESSQLLDPRIWHKVGLNVSITKENNPIFIGKEKNTEKRRNRDIQSAPPIHWDPIGKSDLLPDPIKGANLPRSVDYPYDR